MIKLVLNRINEYSYVFKDINGMDYTLYIDFYNVEKPNIGDIFYFSEKIVNEVNLYTFGPLNEEDKNVSIDDIIKANISGKDIYLQRYYG